MSAFEDLWSPQPPWLYLAPAFAPAIVERAAGRVRTIDGSRMRTTGALLDEFAIGLDLPGWFGHNWDALLDSLLGLEERHAHGLLVVSPEADSILTDAESRQLRVLLEILEDAGREWAEPKTLVGGLIPATPFHALFISAGAGPGSLARRVKEAGMRLAPLAIP